jgi:putative ABC transport system substrate-binding protein
MSAIEGKADIQLIMAKPAREPLSIRTFEPVRCLRLSLGAAMRRRDFIKFFGSTALWPLSARAQQPERMRLIGILLPAAVGDPIFQARLAAFQQELAPLGWTVGRNVRIDTRWATTNPAEIRRHAAELVALAPDVILPFS